MTPFGRKLRSLREVRQCQLKDLAKALRVSSAYLSALEHGHRGKPSPGLVQQVAAYFNLAWEQVDELKALAELSDPRVTIDTAGLTPEATELANRLAARSEALSEGEIARVLAISQEQVADEVVEILRVLNLRDRMVAVVFAHETGIIRLPLPR